MLNKIITSLLLISVFNNSIAGTQLTNPVIFVTQFPIANDFTTIGSTFGNHSGRIDKVGRGGDLYIRYTNGTLRNLTREAGFGNTGLQGANAIAVRDPSIHWSANKALFSMVIGAPDEFEQNQYFWQIYEITGFGLGQTINITKVVNQPNNYNNISPIYGSDGNIIFTTDMPRTKNAFNYPQLDEYESDDTNTGLWKLNVTTGSVNLLQHSPSGSFSPFIDSAGRVIFTRWDHLQRDQQADDPQTYQPFNYSNENVGAQALNDHTEVFPESRHAEGNLEGLRMNHFFPWQLNQDGTEEETINHVGRHEFHDYFNRSINDDPNIVEFAGDSATEVFNFFHLHEDPNVAGHFIGIDAPEFQTHSGGQIIGFNLPVGFSPDLVTTQYLTHKLTSDVTGEVGTPPVEHIGFSRNPIILKNGTIVASHTNETRGNNNEGTRPNPDPRYDFRLKTFAMNGFGFLEPSGNLVSLGNANISYYDPDVLVTYNGPLWELHAVEVVAKPQPPMTTETMQTPELQIFAEESVDVNQFKAFLKVRDLAVVVMRDLTARDAADKQQPYNIKVADSDHQTISQTNPTGTLYEVSHVQFFQGDQIRGYGNIANPDPGQRVLAQYQHDLNAQSNNINFTNAPVGSTEIFPDGSAAYFVPAKRAMAWQSLDPQGTPVVRERFWITFQPGEIRSCGGCHGVNDRDQSGALPSIEKAEAFRALLQNWQTNFPDLIFENGFEL